MFVFSQQDYPSVSQIASKLSEKKANVIFAAPLNRKPDYDALASLLQASASAKVGLLKNDSENIVELIKKAYEVRD